MKALDTLEDFWLWSKYRKRDLGTMFILAGVYFIGALIIVFLEAKEFIERGIKRWKRKKWF